MPKYHFVLAILIVQCLNIFSQDNINSNGIPTGEQKLESLKGFELRLIPYPKGFYTNQTGELLVKPFSTSVYIGYFCEKRIALDWTFLTTVGLHNIAFQSPVIRLVKGGNNDFYSTFGPDRKFSYSLWFEAGIEPRRYLRIKHPSGTRITTLNSGWFLSSPLLFQTIILHSPEPLIHKGWFPSTQYSGTFILTPTIGYRQAVSRQCFVEGDIGFGGNVSVGTNTIDRQFTISTPEFNPSLKLKAAYAFK